MDVAMIPPNLRLALAITCSSAAFGAGLGAWIATHDPLRVLVAMLAFVFIVGITTIVTWLCWLEIDLWFARRRWRRQVEELKMFWEGDA
jgi:hypothetical protein